jgi:1-acyl-sn-glycerol-3-phosphate acyltransferase
VIVLACHGGEPSEATLSAVETRHYRKNEAQDAFSPTGYDKFYWRAVKGSRLLSRLSSRVDLPETVELPTDRPAIIAANHSSLFDLIAALITLGHYGVNARIGVNSRFFKNPIAGWFLRGIGCIPFSRDDREAAEQTMVDALKAGQVCAIMPEGKIIRPDDQVDGVGKGRPGVSRIARRAGAAVVTVGFTNSDKAWRPGTPFPKLANRSTHVITRLGAPIEFDSDDHDANAGEVMQSISELVAEGRAMQKALDQGDRPSPAL